ncbi:MFS transporter [Cohnella zeiphila]|uniref:MFS transporter n=1 Tax=Cohnella zeiphila TaxID=2761120 RepID=UPI001EE2298D|nr:MFS transporter [Cohnella zeiphila]
MQDDKKSVRAWIWYDWANSAFATTIMAAVMPTFYGSVAAAGVKGASSYWGFTQTIAAVLVAVLSPLLGAIADQAGAKKKFLRVFSWIGALACAAMLGIGEGDWLLASILVIIGMIGFGTGSAFYDALLNDVVPPARRETVSAQGYAMGYLGGGILLALDLAIILKPELFGIPDTATASRISFFSVAVWWIVFSLPLFRHVTEPGRTDGVRTKAAELVKEGAARLKDTLFGIRRYPELFKFMLAYWFFFDGINTVIVMATSYGTDIGIGQSQLIGALLITQIVGFPATWLFGRLANRIGGKTMLYASLATYLVIVVLGYFMTTALHFFALAILVGLVQGGAQSTSRAIYSRMIPPGRTAEFNGFLSFSSRFFSLLGPLVFGVVGLATGSSRPALLAIAAFFVIGIALLTLVDLDKGRAEAISSTGQETALPF